MDPVGQYSSNPAWLVTATFSESIQAFEETDITVVGPGTISNFVTTDIFTAEAVDELTPAGGSATWQVRLSVPTQTGVFNGSIQHRGVRCVREHAESAPYHNVLRARAYCWPLTYSVRFAVEHLRRRVRRDNSDFVAAGRHAPPG
eukprot:4320207-Pyramimonas_sp.AAC.1